MFQDKVYEELDDLSKLVEPYNCSFNDDLAKYPDEFNIDFDMFMSFYSKDWGFSSLRLDKLLDKIADIYYIPSLNLRHCSARLTDFFIIEAPNKLQTENITIDLDTKTLSHKIILRKKRDSLSEKEMDEMVRNHITRMVMGNLNSAKALNKSRMNELADLFNFQDVKKDRSFRGKLKKFIKGIEQLMDDHKLNIRDTDLADRVGRWMVMYVKDGNLPALSNITTLKILMHNNRPIYSIDERSVM